MRYAFIERHRQVWPITVQCRVLNVSVSGYHGHMARQASNAPRRHLSDEALLVHIKVFTLRRSVLTADHAFCGNCAQRVCASASSVYRP